MSKKDCLKAMGWSPDNFGKPPLVCEGAYLCEAHKYNPPNQSPSMHRYYHKVINPQLGSLQTYLEIDTNYELVRVVPVSMYETVLVFIEHRADEKVTDLQPYDSEATDE